MVPLSEILGSAAPIVVLRDQVHRLLQRFSGNRRVRPILLLGETGTGKGLLARAIQRGGPRSSAPFVEVNCAAIPENLLEAEMFGFERGAFTDAREAKAGLFQTAHGGTLFLDEVGLLPEALQGKLLKAVEDRVVRRVGGTRSEPADVWVLSATSVDLEAAARERRFREDLYHRLAVFTLTVPPLRERGDDILLLAEHFLARFGAEYALPPMQLSEEARAALLEHRWPGNVRELANVIERAALLSDHPRLDRGALGLGPRGASEIPSSGGEPGPEPLEDAVARVEREHLRAALQRTGWNITRTAEDLAISRDTLRYRIKKHGLEREGGRAAPRSKRHATRAVPPAAPRTTQIARSTSPSASPPRRGMRWVQRRVALLRIRLDEPTATISPVVAARTLDLLLEKATAFGGRVEELGTAGLLAVFGLEPVEDAVQRSAHAALACRNALERLRLGWPDSLRYGLAIHVSALPVGDGEQGLRIDLGAKRRSWQIVEELAAVAEPGAILASEATIPSLLRLFATEPASTVEGVPGRVYRLVGHERAEPGSGRRLSPFVGRERELAVLRAALSSALQGRGQTIGIVGEAGIGKSRLITEFSQYLAEHGVEWLHARCVSHGMATPYLPLVAILRSTFDIDEADDPHAVAEKLGCGLAEAGLDPVTTAPALLHLLGVAEGAEEARGMSPEALRDRTFEALLTLFLERGRRRPLFLAVEDLHWIDRTSEAWLAGLAEHLARAPVSLLCTYRPGYRPPWMERSDATQVALHALGRNDSLALVESLLPAGVDHTVAERILQRGEGNSLFLEELARSVEEERRALGPDGVPVTIQEVLQARIDRLGDEPRRLLDAASVLGRAGSATLLRALWDGTGPPDPLIRELSRLELLHEDGRGESTTYTFRHALVQEATYEALPRTRRLALHAAAAAALESLHPDRLDAVADRLAHHYSRAEIGDKAVEYLSRVADKAARVYAHAEAVSALGEALVHAERGSAPDRDSRVLTLVLRQAHSLYGIGRLAEIVTLLEQHRERLARLDAPSFSGPYYFSLALAWSLLGNPALTVEHGRRALDEASRCGDEITMGKALYVLAYECFWSGRPAEGVTHAHDAIGHLERAEEAHWLGQSWWVLGINHLLAGDFDAALEAERRTCAIGNAIGDPRLRSIGTSTTGACYVLMGEWEAGIETCREGLALSPDPVNTAATTGFLGGAFLEKGDFAEAIPLLERAVALYTRIGVPQTAQWFTALLAEARLLGGQPEEAQILASGALEALVPIRYGYGIAWAERALGRIALGRRDLPEAERWLDQAMATFTSIGARYEAARTHMLLAELSHARGRADRVMGHLREALMQFEASRVPRYIERCRKLAAELGVAGLLG